MSSHLSTRTMVFVAALCVSAVMTLGCDDKALTGPSGPSAGPLAVTSVAPITGPSGALLTISGTGFRTGATVTVGGVAANVTFVLSTISATAPLHAAGPADVVVTNPGGESATLAGAFTYEPLTITSFHGPSEGYAGLPLFIHGTGFLPNVSVTFGGAPASTGRGSSTLIPFTTPTHDLGPVDIVVANPGGESATLNGGFTYVSPPVLTVAPTSVAPGGQLTVSWVATATWGLDWIGLFQIGAHNTTYIKYLNTWATTSGTWTLTAPTQPGQYEFRYLPNDTYADVARSSVVTVTAVPLETGYSLARSLLTSPRPRPSSQR